jgi:site-specific DNA-adenine methylase
MKTPIKDDLNFKSSRIIKELIPKKSVVSSFLFYSGALEFSLAEDKRFVVSHTNKYVIYEFWDCLLREAKTVGRMAKNLFSKIQNENIFYTFQEAWPTYKDPNFRSALFFILNRCSEGGHISCGKFNKNLLSGFALASLQNFKIENFYINFDSEDNWTNNLDEKGEKADYLLFPVGKYNFNLFEYGKNKGFEFTAVNHRELCNILTPMDKRWVVLYKNHKKVFDLYKDHRIIMVDQYGRKTNKKDKCEDIVIANF